MTCTECGQDVACPSMCPEQTGVLQKHGTDRTPVSVLCDYFFFEGPELNPLPRFEFVIFFLRAE